MKVTTDLKAGIDDMALHILARKNCGRKSAQECAGILTSIPGLLPTWDVRHKDRLVFQLRKIGIGV